MRLIPALRLALTPDAPEVITIVGGGGKTSLLFRIAGEIVEAGGRVVTASTTRVTLRQIELAPASLRLEGDDIPWDALARALDEHAHCMLVGNETLLEGKQRGVSPAVIDALTAHAGRLGLSAILVEGDGSRTLPVKAPGDHEPVIAPSTTLVLPVLGLEAIGAPIDEAHAHRPLRMCELLGIAGDGVRLTPAMAARLLRDPQGGAKAVPAGARLLPVLNKADIPARRTLGRLAAHLLAEDGYASLICSAGNPEVEPVVERWGPVAAIVLAAGAARRYGTAKQLAQVDGEPFVQRAARIALEGGVQQVVVVTGAHGDAVAEALAALLAEQAGRLRLQTNPEWAAGHSSSLRAGLDALPSQTQAAIFLPADQPHLDAALLRRMVAAWRSGAPIAAPVVDGTVRGAPALFDQAHFPALRAVTGDVGGRALLRQHAADVAAIPADAAMLADVDWPAGQRMTEF